MVQVLKAFKRVQKWPYVTQECHFLSILYLKCNCWCTLGGHLRFTFKGHFWSTFRGTFEYNLGVILGVLQNYFEVILGDTLGVD